MNAVLVPVKAFRDSKKRLAPFFSPEARAALAESLCRDFFETLAAVRGTRIFVVSSEEQALDWAAARGWETIPETTQQSESASVDAASHICAARGVTALLRIPMDLPLVEAGDIDTLFAAVEGAPSCILVPSRDGTGTNALLRTPPALFRSHFGPHSFARHRAEAERCGAHVTVVKNAHIGWDVDEPDDLTGLPTHLKRGSATERWARRHL